MGKEKKIIIGLILMSILFSVIIATYRNYMDEIGGYDLWTLANFSMVVDDIINEYDKNELTQLRLEQHYDIVSTLSRYAQISPIISYLSYDMGRLESISYEDLSNGRIENFRNLSLTFKDVIEELHKDNPKRVGIRTYNYLKDVDVRNRLLNSFDFIEN